MSSTNGTGCGKSIGILAGLATIVGVIIAFFTWIMPFSPVGSSPVARQPSAPPIAVATQVPQSSPTISPKPTSPPETVSDAPVSAPTAKSHTTKPPVANPTTPSTASDEAVPFGRSKDIDGLVVSVSAPDYDSGCGGTMDFEIVLSNQTQNAILLSFGLEDIKLLGNGGSQLSLYGDIGAATPRCYGRFDIGALAPNATGRFALRTTESLGSFDYIDLIFGSKTERLSGQKWRLDLRKTVSPKRTLFGETINLEGLEVTVGAESYFPGCDGTLGFQITLRNSTGKPVVLGMNSGNIKLYGSDQSGLSIYSQFGKQSVDCYSSFDLETIKAGETALIAVRNTRSLSGLSHVDFVFETTNRLNGLRWRLNLPR